MATPVKQTGTVVVGYFATGHAAHRAVNALIDEGFLPSEIGAAFHAGPDADRPASERTEGSQPSHPNVGGSLRDELGTTYPEVSGQGSTTVRGAASGTTAVQYAALGGGAGTPVDGAGRPKPITGSDLTHSGLPSELKSSLPHEEGMQERASGSSYAGRSAVEGTTTRTGESWTEKLKHVFSSPHSESKRADTESKEEEYDAAPKAPVTKESQAFGTGEGHLELGNADSTRPYSQPAFESSFSDYGVQPEHARYLSHRIGHGGAIVTVHSPARATDAERVLEAHGGEVRFTGGPASDALADESQVEVFGTVGRDYSGYID